MTDLSAILDSMDSILSTLAFILVVINTMIARREQRRTQQRLNDQGDALDVIAKSLRPPPPSQ